jgi:hypothetical protein
MKPALENTKIAKTLARCDAKNFLAFLVLPFSQIMYSPAFRDGPTFFILPSEILCACPCPFSLPSPTIRLSPMEGVTHSTSTGALFPTTQSLVLALPLPLLASASSLA